MQILSLSYFPGYGYGLKNHFIKSKIKFESSKYELKKINSKLIDILPEYKNMVLEDDVILNILNYIVELQKQNKHPIFSKPRILSLSEDNGNLIYDFIMPVYRYKISVNILNWILLNIIPNLENINLESLNNYYNDLVISLKNSSLIGINRIQIIDASYSLNIPHHIFEDQTIQIGYGKNSRWLYGTITDKTNPISINISGNKVSTSRLLNNLSIPVAKQKVIYSFDELEKIVDEIGFPIVIKPSDSEGGRGVWGGINSLDTAKLAYQDALKYSKNIIVEEHINGSDYRITVFNNEVIKVILRIPGGVIGDGKKTIKELVNDAQRDPQIARRSKERGYSILSLDEEALSLLKEQSLTINSILPKDYFLALRRKANAYAGGKTVNIPLSKIHLDNIKLAIKATKALRLDISGIDLIIKDISKSWKEIGGIICEVNAEPQIGLNDTPNIYKYVVKKLSLDDGYIPLLLNIGNDNIENNKFINKNMNFFKNNGTFSIASDNLLLINNDYIKNDKNYYKNSQALMLSQEVNSGLIFSTISELFNYSLAFQYIDILTIFNDIKITESEMIDFFNMILPHSRKILINISNDKICNYLINNKSTEERLILISTNGFDENAKKHISKHKKVFWYEDGIIHEYNGEKTIKYPDIKPSLSNDEFLILVQLIIKNKIYYNINERVK